MVGFTLGIRPVCQMSAQAVLLLVLCLPEKCLRREAHDWRLELRLICVDAGDWYIELSLLCAED
jgi:hypothetical protein